MPHLTSKYVRRSALFTMCISVALAACGVPMAHSVKKILVERIGDRVCEIIRSRDGRALQAAGLSTEHADELMRRFRAPGDVDKLSMACTLSTWGLGEAATRKAIACGTSVMKLFRADPFGSARKAGASLIEADKVATALGASRTDRILGHVVWEAEAAARDGDTVVPLASIVRKFGAQEVRALADRGKFVIAKVGDTEYVTTNDRYEAEMFVANELRRRARETFLAPDVFDDLDSAIAPGGLVPEQLAAARAVARSSVVVLTGPPGSGKSCLVRAIVGRVGADKCLLTAPTGRCARTLEGRTVHSHTARAGARTETAHRRPIQETGAIPSDLALLACDESSMLTTELMASVLRLAPPTCHILLVGDVDQLPPVGAGNVLADILASGVCPVVRLTMNHRNEAAISALASAVLRGNVSDLDCSSDGSVVFEPPSLGGAVARALEGAQPLVHTNAARTQLNRAIQAANARSMDVVLRKDYRGFRRGQRATLHGSSGLAQLVVAERRIEVPLLDALDACDTVPTGRLASEPRVYLAPGDPVIVLKNQPSKPGERPVCNGDVGVLLDFGNDRATIDLGDGEAVIKFPPGRADKHLTLAHALTVHKSQGGEFDSVLVSIAAGGFGWSRSLLYTAITRAKKKVIIIGSMSDVRAIAARAQRPRMTLLRHLLS